MSADVPDRAKPITNRATGRAAVPVCAAGVTSATSLDTAYGAGARLARVAASSRWIGADAGRKNTAPRCRFPAEG